MDVHTQRIIELLVTALVASQTAAAETVVNDLYTVESALKNKINHTDQLRVSTAPGATRQCPVTV